MNNMEDFRTEPEDGAPISLKKVSKILKPSKEIYVLIDSSSSGFVNDDPSLVEVSIQDREEQAMYFLNLDIATPPYLKKYLEFMYAGEKVDIDSMMKHGKTNPELKQIIGLVQLVGGSLNHARKNKVHFRMHIQEPETRMHPKREAKIVSLIEMLKKDYGFNKKDESK